MRKVLALVLIQSCLNKEFNSNLMKSKVHYDELKKYLGGSYDEYENDLFDLSFCKAMKNNHIEKLKWLMEDGDWTWFLNRPIGLLKNTHLLPIPLYYAAGEGYREIAELLINKGADVNIADGS